MRLTSKKRLRLLSPSSPSCQRASRCDREFVRERPAWPLLLSRCFFLVAFFLVAFFLVAFFPVASSAAVLSAPDNTEDDEESLAHALDDREPRELSYRRRG